MTSKEKKISPSQDNFAKLELIRRFKANPFIFIGTVIVLIIVIVAFVFVPAIVPSAGGLNIDLSFGSYNKIPITYVPGGYFAQVREAIAASYQQNNYEHSIDNKEVWRTAFEAAVTHTGILDELKHAGYTAPQKIVDRRIAELPRFQENGLFSSARYKALDKTTRMSLWRQVHESLAEEYYRTDITELRISSKETPFIAAMNSPQRTFDMAAFSLYAYPDTEINAYATAHGDLFLVTHLSRITLNTSERETGQILGQIQGGASTFEDAARTYSQDSYGERGGDMGIRMAYDFITEVPDAEDRESLMKLTTGELSPIIKVPDGWAFFRAEDAPRPADTNDPGLLEKIRAYVMEFERGQVEDFFLNQAEQLIAQIKEHGFNEALGEWNIQKRTFGPFPVNYGGVPLFNSLIYLSAPEIARAGYNITFWETAFSTPLLSPSKALVIDTNVIVLYPTEETDMTENTEYIATAYPSYLQDSLTNEDIRTFFLNNKKLVDHFWTTYNKYFQPLN